MQFIIAILLMVVSTGLADNLPERFFGKFSLDRSDNFDSYLEAKGYGWFLRKLVAFANVENVFTKAGSDSFHFDIITTKKDIHYRNVEIGKEFIGKGFDSIIRGMTEKDKVLFTLRNGVLHERHIPANQDSARQGDNYDFRVEGDTLVQTLEFNGIVATRYFKRQ